MNNNLIRNYNIDELKDIALNLGQEKYRGEQLFRALFAERKDDFDDMRILPLEFREKLKEKYKINSIVDHNTQHSQDGTVKFFFTLTDGNKIETVLIPGDRKKERLTLCISSQIGCTLNCTFCATGKLPFKRNLEAAEIIDQVLFAEKIENVKLTNIVFMGMGEPMYNLNNVIKAIRIISNPKLKIMSQKRITVSTSGVLKKINELADSGLKVKLAISLHATTDNLRKKLIPYAERVSVSHLMDSVEYYYRATKLPVTYEYIFLEGINDMPEDVKRLSKIVKKLPSKVNIIPYNDISFTGAAEVLEFKNPSPERMKEFADALRGEGVKTFIRTSSGFDIDAACGQLAYSERNS
jgi:23S rRNA (adenine2503-C2)-methyltransferase